ncbi:MAG: hypothetical protein ACE10B_09675 [Phycisphaerales bacterium]
MLRRHATGAIKSLRSTDEPMGTPIRLAIGVIVAVGVVAVVWLMGVVGFRLGFAPLIRVPGLLSEPGGGLVTGTIMIISIPRVILLAGGAQPTWLMLGFAAIAIPAAGLGAVRHRPGGIPRPSLAAVVFTLAGAICAALNALAVIWWTACNARNARFADLPDDPAGTDIWLENLQTVAGLDVLAVIAATVWVVLVMRLSIPLWLRALAASASYVALVVAIVAMSMSIAAFAQIQAARSVVHLDDGSIDARLVLGFTPGHVATLRIENEMAIVELRDRSDTMTVVGRQSIVGMLQEAAQRSRGNTER